MKPGRLELVLYTILIITFTLGIYWGFADQQFFTDRYMMEDGEIEYATVILLLSSCILVATRWIRLYKKRSLKFSIVCWSVLLAFLFVAGEEISWGQRIFGIETTEYFMEHNAQGETNLHNLVVGEVKINKLIFGVTLTTIILIYLIVIPILYQKSNAIKNLIDKWYIPVPRPRHSISYLAITLIIMLIPASKKWELLEFGSVLIFFLILWVPVNYQIWEES